MFELLFQYVAACKDLLCTEYLVNDLCQLIRTSTGRFEAVAGGHDDSLCRKDIRAQASGVAVDACRRCAASARTWRRAGKRPAQWNRKRRRHRRLCSRHADCAGKPQRRIETPYAIAQCTAT